jgi:hypothetical protein
MLHALKLHPRKFQVRRQTFMSVASSSAALQMRAWRSRRSAACGAVDARASA